ncbi:MAG: response regulator [Nitrospirales bacterium]|nr:response regulator [Nitrospirales bacterium]
MPGKSTTVLLVEDNPADIFMVQEMLTDTGLPLSLETAGRLAFAIERIVKGGLDLIILDLGLPDCHGIETVRTVVSHAHGLPVVVLTSFPEEEMGLRALQSGAEDYLVKGRVNSASLKQAMVYAIERKTIERERDMLLDELREAAAKVKRLSGLLPICSYCKRVRNDKGYWEQIEAYLREHSEADVNLGLCPDCAGIPRPAGEEKDGRSER